MKVNIENFIGVFENAIEDKWCDSIIEWYDLMEKSYPKSILNRQSFENSHPISKKNNFLYLQPYIKNLKLKKLHDHFMNILMNKVFLEYQKKYFGLNPNELYAEDIKIQKTEFEEGYHLWHYEHGSGNADRVLVYMVYLNDVLEGGETEFLYQRRRVQPKKGTMMLFPPNFTHTHRGNPPLSNHKYAITGWICLKNP